MAERLVRILLAAAKRLAARLGRVSYKAVKTAVLRTYALAILLIVLWAGGTAVNYLVRQVFLPTPVPQRFLDWQGTLNADALRAKARVPGVTGPSMRAPIGHFHSVGQWFQHDPANGCTPAGCHSPLPHQKTPAVRAFANLHATFLNCRTCHTKAAQRPAPAVWIDLDSARPCEPPAILRLIQYLQAHYDAQHRQSAPPLAAGAPSNAEPANDSPDQVQRTVLPLLSETVRVADDHGVLAYLLLRLETSPPDSPVWRHAMAQLVSELPVHARGEYGAKIAVGHDDQPRQQNARLRELAENYFRAQPDSDARRNLYSNIHVDVVVAPQGCLSCHSDGQGGREPPLVDLAPLGYSKQRIDELQNLLVARMAEQVRQGRPFYLPALTEDGNE